MPSTPPLPGPLRLPPSFPFVGRTRELATLRALVPLTPGEGRRAAFVAGEPGSGKSRLVRELACSTAAEEDVTVLYGSCDAVVRTPYGPFVSALGHYVRHVDPDDLRRRLGTGGGELTRLLPDLKDRVGRLPPPLQGDVDTERLRLHTAVTELLAAVAEEAPLLLLLEDVHWADAATLQLVRHLVRAGSDVRMLLVATFRDVEADVPAELSEALVDVHRSEGVVRLHLDGLSALEVAEFVRLAAGVDVMSDVSAVIGELTAGNAFLMTELWRELLASETVQVGATGVRLTRPAAELGTPETVRQVVSHRLARLAPETGVILEVAAVSGGRVELVTLRRVAAIGESALLDAVDEAARSGLVEEVPSRGLAYRFTHELVRRSVLDRLSAPRRAELHLRVAEALESTAVPGDDRARLAALAHHFTEAAPLGETARAIYYNLLAAESAAGALSFEEAASLLRNALELGIDDPRQRTEAFLALGSELYRAGRSLESLAAFRQAAELARSTDDGELFARAAIGFESTCWRPGLNDQGALALLAEAVDLLGPEDSVLRCRLLTALSRAHDELHGHHDRGRAARDSAIAMARRIGDDAGLAIVLSASYWSDQPRSEVLEMLAEARALAADLGDLELEAEAMEWRIAALMAMGEMEAASLDLSVVLEQASRTRQPFICHVAEHYASALALMEGRLADAEAAAERSREWGQLLTGRDASGVHGIQMFGVRREQGRLGELAPVMRLLASNEREGGAWRPGFAALLAELDMKPDALRELERVRRLGLDRLRESLWLASLTYLTDASCAVGDAETATLLYPELAPLAGISLMIGHGVACYGSADRYLGMLAATSGENELAERHFEVALAANRKMGATTWLAHTEYEFGRMLIAAGRADQAGPLLVEALAHAEQVGMPTLIARLRRLGVNRAPAWGAPDDLSARELDVLRLVSQGLSNREAGRALHLSEHTVANHMRSILRKTGTANRTEAATYAHRRGLTTS